MDLRTDSAETLAWQHLRDQQALAHLSCLPDLTTWVDRSLAVSAATARTPVVTRPNGEFQLRLMSSAAERPALTLRTDGLLRVLVDPDELTAKQGAPVDLAWFEPSPDGRVLAYATTSGGDEVARVVLLDVHTGTQLPDVVPWNVMFPVSWLPDGTAFWCSGREVRGGVFMMPLYRFELGEPAPAEPYPLPPMPFPRPEVAADGSCVLLVTGNTEARLDHLIDAEGQLRPLLAGLPGGAVGSVLDGTLYAVVEHDAPRGRLVAIPIESAQDPTTWIELRAQSDDVLRWLRVVDGRLVLGYLRDASAGLQVLDLNGSLIEEVQLPGAGVVSVQDRGLATPLMPMFVAGERSVSFVHSTFTRSPAVYRYDVRDRVLEVVDPPEHELLDVDVQVVAATSADGIRVLSHVVSRADLDRSAPHPTLITGYGGYNVALLPSWLGPLAAWVEAGGVFVLSHLRGGSEHGSTWWHDGMRENKQHTFDDLYAVAEELVTTGWTTPEQLAFKGGSNGGLLAGVAITQRPELWKAVIADVPVLDLLELTRDPLTYAIARGEYGDPLVPAEAEWLAKYSPVHNVQPSALPAVLLVAGANDPRCPTWHARVFLDLLEQAQQADAPVLLRVHDGQGHGAASERATARRTAECLAFAADRVGLRLS